MLYLSMDMCLRLPNHLGGWSIMKQEYVQWSVSHWMQPLRRLTCPMPWLTLIEVELVGPQIQ